MFTDQFRRTILLALPLFAAAIAQAPNVAVAQPSASVASAPDMSIWSDEILADGRSRFMFTNWDGPDLPIWAYVPTTVEKRTAPIMILLHGAKRDPRRYLEEWAKFADEDGFIIIAPEYNKKDFPGSRGYNLGNIWSRGEKEPNPRGEWSFAAVEPLFDSVVATLGGTQKQYTLYGHSAGSQFVHRFMFIMPEARVSRYLPANAGWYTEPDQTIEFPYGLKGLGVSEDMIKEALANHVVILLGDQDTDKNHDSLRRTKEAMRQGPHRFARGQSFFCRGEETRRRNGHGVQLVIPDHSGSCAFQWRHRQGIARFS